jgi:hypothetical protein
MMTAAQEADAQITVLIVIVIWIAFAALIAGEG